MTLSKQSRKLHKQLDQKVDKELAQHAESMLGLASQAEKNCCEDTQDDSKGYKACNEPAAFRVRGNAGEVWRLCKKHAEQRVAQYEYKVLGPWKKGKS